MLGDVIELSVVVRDLEAAIKRFEKSFDLKVYSRSESEEFGYKNAILPLGRGHIELLQPTDPTKSIGRFLETRGEGVYLVGFENEDIDASVKKLQAKGVKVTSRPGHIAWVHPREAHGVFVELRKPQKYT